MARLDLPAAVYSGAMEAWWISLNLPLQVFYVIGIVSALFLGLQVLSTMFGMDHHDVSGGLDHPDDLGFLSVRTITGFFFGFGWTGIIGLKSGLSLLAATLWAAVVGAAFLLGIYGLMRALFSMRASGTLDYANAIGQVATVYVTVPAARAPGGQIEVMVQGRLGVVSCLSAHSEPLRPGQKVKVTAQIDQGTLEVQPL